jgi:hypothetical protein
MIVVMEGQQGPMFLLRRAALLRGAIGRRAYSEAIPLGTVHKQVQDVETLFQKYKLHELKSKEEIDALVRSGAISEHIGKELNHDLKVQQEAGSTLALCNQKLNFCRDC